MSECERPECPKGENENLRETIRQVSGGVARTEAAVARLELTINGDGNGNKGLVRKMDLVQQRVEDAEKFGWKVLSACIVILAAAIAATIGLR